MAGRHTRAVVGADAVGANAAAPAEIAQTRAAKAPAVAAAARRAVHCQQRKDKRASDTAHLHSHARKHSRCVHIHNVTHTRKHTHKH